MEKREKLEKLEAWLSNMDNILAVALNPKLGAMRILEMVLPCPECLAGVKHFHEEDRREA